MTPSRIMEKPNFKNYHKAQPNWTKIGLFGTLRGGNLKNIMPSIFRLKIVSFEPKMCLLRLLRSWEMSKSSFLRGKICCFVAVLISIIGTILESGNKGLSILNVSAGSVKIQLHFLPTVGNARWVDFWKINTK